MSEKKVATKKIATKKVVAAKKIASKKVTTGSVTKGKINPPLSEEVVNTAKKATVKAMKDVDKVQEAINLLKSVENEKVATMIAAEIIKLDDINYLIVTGKPRIDNLKAGKTACELANSGAYDTKGC